MPTQQQTERRGFDRSKYLGHPTTRRKYALQGVDKARQAIEQEIGIMKNLVHENVVRLHEVIDDEVSQYIFMVLEYIPGGPIYDPVKFQQMVWIPTPSIYY
jgi:[calcium/calmodulin-dependent protein kinase] kinase